MLGPELSISIVNTSNWKYLSPCLNSIYDNISAMNFEILVVDNHSDDGSKKKIRESFPNVILSCNERRFGFAKNNNINLKKSSGDFILLLNDDTLLIDDTLELAINFMKKNTDVGILGCRMIDPDGKVQKSSARRFDTLLSTFIAESGISNIFRSYSTSIIEHSGENIISEIDCPQESGMIIRRKTLEEIGLLDEKFFMFGEGLDWCRRIKNKDWKIIYFPLCKIIHFGGETNSKINKKMYLQHYKSMNIYFSKISRAQGFLHRVLIIFIYSYKYLFKIIENFFRKIIGKEKNEKISLYKSIIDLFLFRYDDQNYPFPR
tara:strand:+ start:42421 stop:43377 length:957 start_codon:yes stop_codon:yes gene_type:complete